MRIMVYDAPKTIKLETAEELVPIKNQIKIELMFSGISHGTEMNVYRGMAPFFSRVRDAEYGIFKDAVQSEKWSYPIKSNAPGVWYMGYAAVGKVVAIGDAVTKVELGDIVYANAPHQTHAVVNESEVFVLPKDVAPQNAVVFTNTLTAYNSILDAGVKLGDTAVVSGLGVLGQLASQMAKLSGAIKVIGIDLSQKRLQAAKENGIDVVLNPTDFDDIALEVRKLTNGKGADAVIEFSGNQKALHNAIRMAGNDCAVTAAGWYQGGCMDLNLSEEFHHNRIALKSSQTCAVSPAFSHMYNDKRKSRICQQLLPVLKLDNLITDIVDYENVQEAYRTVDQTPGNTIQVVLKY